MNINITTLKQPEIDSTHTSNSTSQSPSLTLYWFSTGHLRQIENVWSTLTYVVYQNYKQCFSVKDIKSDFENV